MSNSLIEPGLVALDVDLGSSKAEVIRGLAGIVAAAGRAEAEGLAADVLTREGKSATGMPGGFAIPHCRSAAVNQASLGFARLATPVDFGAKDGPSDLVFMIAAAESGGADHMKLLTKLARALVRRTSSRTFGQPARSMRSSASSAMWWSHPSNSQCPANRQRQPDRQSRRCKHLPPQATPLGRPPQAQRL